MSGCISFCKREQQTQQQEEPVITTDTQRGAHPLLRRGRARLRRLERLLRHRQLCGTLGQLRARCVGARGCSGRLVQGSRVLLLLLLLLRWRRRRRHRALRRRELRRQRAKLLVRLGHLRAERADVGGARLELRAQVADLLLANEE